MSELAAAAPGGESDKEAMPTMGFLDHLEELRKRIVYSMISIAVGAVACWYYRELIYGVMQRPIMDALRANGMPEKLVYLNPTEPFNLYLKIAALGGLFLTSPFVLYQVWMFISPGLYRNEKRYVVPFMISTITLFTAGRIFRVQDRLSASAELLYRFQQAVPAHDHDRRIHSLFLSIVLGMGLIFEMPILVFFLSLMGIMSPRFMWTNFRYAILVIFIIAAIVTPTPDIVNMCVFAAPMLALYALSIGVSWLVHPKQRATRKAKAAQ